MKRAIIIIAAALLPMSSSAQPNNSRHANHSGQANHSRGEGAVTQEEGSSMEFIGQDGRIVDMKKDKCWDPVTHPYRAPGWCSR